MKTLLKNLVNYSLASFLCLSLFSFPVFAEEYTDYEDYLTNNATTFLSDLNTVADGFDNSQACIKFLELPYAQRQAILNLDHANKQNNLVFLSSTGTVYTVTGAWFTTGSFSDPLQIFISSSASNKGYRIIDSSGNLGDFVTVGVLDASISAVFYWSAQYGGNDPFGSISFDGNLCQVTPDPTATPFPSDDPYACKFALNEVISNDYVASLVAYAEKQNYDTPYFIYRVYYSDSADDMNILLQSGVYTDVEPFQIKGYVLSTQELAYPVTYVLEYKQLRKLVTDDVTMFSEFDLLDRMMYPFYELVLVSSCLETGTFSEIDATNQVNSSINQTIIQNSQIISGQNQTNNLIDSGNSSSQGASNSINSATSQFDFAASQLESFESQFNGNLTDSLASIDISSGSLSNVSDFVSTASFVKTQFDGILNDSGIYKSVLSFSLIVGLALLLIGRKG